MKANKIKPPLLRIRYTYVCGQCGESVMRKDSEPAPKSCPFCLIGKMTVKSGVVDGRTAHHPLHS